MHRSENKSFLEMSTLAASIWKVCITIIYEDTQSQRNLSDIRNREIISEIFIDGKALLAIQEFYIYFFKYKTKHGENE